MSLPLDLLRLHRILLNVIQDSRGNSSLAVIAQTKVVLSLLACHLAGQAVCISYCCMCYICVTRNHSDFVILSFKAFVHSKNMLVAYK